MTSTASTSMKVVRKPLAMQRLAGAQERAVIGLVPTMGALHEGHAELVRVCRPLCDILVVSVFVNPKQFGPREDLRAYPRTLEADRQLLARLGVDVLFAPSARDMYPEGYSTYVDVDGPARGLCGASRPGHFRGVATVVVKLLNLVGPDIVVFGEKDIQQLAVVRRVLMDLNFPVRVVAVPTVREQDGLAMSSRNDYLDPRQRSAAPALRRSLLAAARAAAEGEGRPRALAEIVRRGLQDADARVDYVEVVDRDLMRPVSEVSGRAVLAAAAFFGDTRLIDNILLRPPRRGRTGGRGSTIGNKPAVRRLNAL